MNDIVIGGAYTSALTHFAGFGIASILDEAGIRGVRLRWTDEVVPRLTLAVPGTTESAAASIVAQHARRHAEPESWVQARTSIRKGAKDAEVGLFSPRIAAPEDAAAWATLYHQRRTAVDGDVGFTWLDGRMLQSLGEPAYWQAGLKDAMPDEGASRWEMKTRNRGEDFVRSRLAALAVEVAGRESERIELGLAGKHVDDSARKLDSRTGTGLVAPQPVDDAVAWCALWGIGAFTLFPQLRGVAVTPGAWPISVTHPSVMALPMSTSPMSMGKLRRTIRSKMFREAAFAGRSTDSAATMRMAAARVSMRKSGVDGIVAFPIRKGGSSSAPERQVLAGTFERF